MDEYINSCGGRQLSRAELDALARNEANCSCNQKKHHCGFSRDECEQCPFGEGHLLYNTVDPYQRVWMNQKADYYEGLNKEIILPDWVESFISIIIMFLIAGIPVWWIYHLIMG